jgi:hypothetical protein
MTSQVDCSENNSGLRAYIPHILAGVTFTLLFLGWLFFVRSSDVRPVLAAPSTAAQRNAQTVAYYGDGKLKVLQFYANPTTLRSGSRALVSTAFPTLLPSPLHLR